MRVTVTATYTHTIIQFNDNSANAHIHVELCVLSEAQYDQLFKELTGFIYVYNLDREESWVLKIPPSPYLDHPR